MLVGVNSFAVLPESIPPWVEFGSLPGVVKEGLARHPEILKYKILWFGSSLAPLAVTKCMGWDRHFAAVYPPLEETSNYRKKFLEISFDTINKNPHLHEKYPPGS